MMAPFHSEHGGMLAAVPSATPRPGTPGARGPRPPGRRVLRGAPPGHPRQIGAPSCHGSPPAPAPSHPPTHAPGSYPPPLAPTCAPSTPGSAGGRATARGARSRSAATAPSTATGSGQAYCATRTHAHAPAAVVTVVSVWLSPTRLTIGRAPGGSSSSSGLTPTIPPTVGRCARCAMMCTQRPSRRAAGG